MAEQSEPKRRVAFIPLESNPDTFTSLAHKLGVSKELSFTDVYSLTEEDLLAFIPRPAHALILIFPTTDDPFKKNNEPYTINGVEGPVLWIKQTIQNACGLMALLHSVLNGTARETIVPGSDLATLLEECKPLDPYQRAELLIKSPSLAVAHKEAAEAGETVAPDAHAEVDYHYIAFVKANGDDRDVYEMDGSRPGARQVATLEADAGIDLLASASVREVVQEKMLATRSTHCGIVALVSA